MKLTPRRQDPARRVLPFALLVCLAMLVHPSWSQQLATAKQLPAATFKVTEQEVDDLKAVFATVRSKDRIDARVRTPGTVVSLKVDEGAHVEPGQVLAIIADPKIALRIKALDAQIVGLESRVATAKLDYDRAEQLRQRGVTAQARVDQLKTAYDLATNELKSVRVERQVAEQQISEGQVLAPAAGRVLKVPVTTGTVMMAGESVATIAANLYLLRLELPERHARFMKKGDPVRIGARGLSPDQQVIGEGRIVQVYPELQSGRVLADAEVPNLGDYFVGERALVWISAGKRQDNRDPGGLHVSALRSRLCTRPAQRRRGPRHCRATRPAGPDRQRGGRLGGSCRPGCGRHHRSRRGPAMSGVTGEPGRMEPGQTSLGLSGQLTRAFIASPLTPLFLLAAFALGLVALFALPREEEPQISVPMVDIFVRTDGLQAPRTACASSPSRSRPSSRRSTVSSMSTRIRWTIASL